MENIIVFLLFIIFLLYMWITTLQSQLRTQKWISKSWEKLFNSLIETLTDATKRYNNEKQNNERDKENN